MKTIKELEDLFIESMYNKTIDFVNESLTNLLSAKEYDKNLTFALINMQLANEFSLKAALVSKHGIQSVLKTKKNKCLSDNDILKDYNENKLSLKDYNEIKNFAFSNNSKLELNGKYKRDMEKFQLYRNKIIHSIYNFEDKTFEEIKKETYHYFLTAINSIFLNIDRSQISGHLVEGLSYKLKELSSDPIYLKCIEEYLGQEHFSCVICDYPSVTDDFVCLLCFESFKTNEFVYGFTDCPWCRIKDCVIYDNLNDTDTGFCMNCEEKVFLDLFER
ncbi:hypothetical protein [Lactococcus lactis]|uniref:hypothetical protein n=1 Tax=Lactococcus lactis TaxID=1358 RepID=UPI0032E43F71